MGEATAEGSIEVTPVPDEIEFLGIPDSVRVDSTTPFVIRIPSAWAGSAVEVRAPEATLKATGPVEENLDSGSRILPLTDATGAVEALLVAPGDPMELILTASLFETIETRVVRVVE